MRINNKLIYHAISKPTAWAADNRMALACQNGKHDPVSVYDSGNDFRTWYI